MLPKTALWPGSCYSKTIALLTLFPAGLEFVSCVFTPHCAPCITSSPPCRVRLPATLRQATLIYYQEILKQRYLSHGHHRPDIRKPFCIPYFVIQGFNTRRSTPRIANSLRQAHCHQRSRLINWDCRNPKNLGYCFVTSRHVNTLHSLRSWHKHAPAQSPATIRLPSRNNLT